MAIPDRVQASVDSVLAAIDDAGQREEEEIRQLLLNLYRGKYVGFFKTWKDHQPGGTLEATVVAAGTRHEHVVNEVREWRKLNLPTVHREITIDFISPPPEDIGE